MYACFGLPEPELPDQIPDRPKEQTFDEIVNDARGKPHWMVVVRTPRKTRLCIEWEDRIQDITKQYETRFKRELSPTRLAHVMMIASDIADWYREVYVEDEL